MVKKISVKQKTSVKQHVNVRVHIHDKKKKRNYRKKRSVSTGASSSVSNIPFNPVYIQSGNAPHLEVPTIRTPALVEPAPAVNRLGAEPLQNNAIPRGVVSEVLPVENIVKKTRRTKAEMDEARAMGLRDRYEEGVVRSSARRKPIDSDSDSDSDSNVPIRSVVPFSSVNGGGVSAGGSVATKRTYKPRRPKEVIEAEKKAKEARKLDRQLFKK